VIQANIQGNAFGLIAIQRVEQGIVSAEAVPELVVLAAIMGAIVFVLAPRRLFFLLPATVLAYFIVIQFPIVGFTRADSRAAAAGGIQNQERDWIDRAVGGNADVSILFYAPNAVAFWENEFFNASVKRSFDLTAGNYDGLPQTLVQPTGARAVLRDASGQPMRSRYVLTNQQIAPQGKLVASDRTVGMYGYRTPSPVRLAAKIDGISGDRWSGPTVDYTRYSCGGGTLTTWLLGDPTLEPHPESVVASVAGKTVAAKTFTPTVRPVAMRVPLRGSGGLCHVTFTVSPTVVPAQVTGTADTRTLGVRFLRFAYRPG
jgi:hypothetical protein